MDINDFLNNGATIPNPNYKKPSKSNPAGSPKYIKSDTYGEALDYGSRLGQHLAANSYDLTYLNKDDNKYEEYDVHINPVNTQDELNKERAENQGALEQFGNFLAQGLGAEAIVGMGLAISDIVDASVNIFTPSGENDYTNPVSTALEEVQDDIRKRFEIYQKDPNATWAMNDFGWWTSNAVSVFTTLSLMLPSAGVAKGLSLLGKIGKIGTKASRGLAKATKAITGSTKSTTRLAESIKVGTEIGVAGLASRTMEGYLEARSVHKEVKDKILSELSIMSDEDREKMIERNPELIGKSDEEMANYIAGLSADETFINDYGMLLMDIMQFKAIAPLWKGLASKTPSATIRRLNTNSYKNLVGESVEEASKKAVASKWLKNRITEIKESFKHPLTTATTLQLGEGFEEGYQGVQIEKGKEIAEMILNPNYTPKTINSYINDSHIWEQAFWGTLGGIVFQQGGTALGNLYRKGEAYVNYKRGKLSEEDFKQNLTADEKARKAEIDGRIAKHQDFVDKMKLLNSLQDPDNYKYDPITKKIITEDGVDQHKELTEEEAEIKKADLVNSYIEALVTNAVDVGNYDLLKEYLNSNEFNKYFENAGLELTRGDKLFNQQLLERAEGVRNYYEDNLYNVLSNSEVDNYSIARIAAREITREQLEIDEYSERLDTVKDKIEDLNNADLSAIDSYLRNNIAAYVNFHLTQLQKAQDSMHQAFANNEISEQAKKEYENIYTTRRKSLIKFLNENNPFDGEIKKEIEKIYKELKLDNNTETIDNDTVTATIDKAFKVIESLINEKSTEQLPKNIAELLDKQIILQDAISHRKFMIPKTQKDYNERIDEISRNVDKLVKERLDKAAKNVEQYILSQEDLNKARKDIYENNVPSLKKDLDLLKLGFYHNEDYTATIEATILEEQAKRDKIKNAPVIQDGVKVSEEQKQKTQDEIEAVNQQAEENKKQNDKTSPFTGEETKSNTEDAEGIIKGGITKADIEDLDAIAKTNEKDSEKIAQSYDLSELEYVKFDAIDRTYALFRDNKEIFNNAFGKEFESPEIQNILNNIISFLETKGYNAGVIREGATSGLRTALSSIAGRLQQRNDSNAEKFKNLALTIASKIEITDINEKNATTTTLSDKELNKVIDELLKVYIKYKGIIEIQDQKTIINLESLFNDIIYNEEIGIDVDNAMHILWNMKDYINDFKNPYIFTHKRSLNAILKNPSEFINALLDARIKKDQLDNYMHISSSNVSNEDKAEYTAFLSGLKGDEEITIEPIESKNRGLVSISFKVNNKEIGFISSVTPTKDNTGYAPYISPRTGGIAYNITKTKNGYKSNTDKLFDKIFDDTYNNGFLWNIINKYHKIKYGGGHITTKEYEDFINDPIIQKSISEFIIFPKKWNGSKLVDKLVTNTQKAQFILHKLEGVVFYDVFAQSYTDYTYSYKQWLENAYTNYKNTHKIQTALQKDKKLITRFGGFSNGYGGTKNTELIINDENVDINTLPFTDLNHIVAVDKEGLLLFENKEKQSATITAPFMPGTMGYYIGGRETSPAIAIFTESNKLQEDTKKDFKNEIIDILTKFQEEVYNFEEVDRRFSSLFNGPGIGRPTIFQGYSVIHDGSVVALANDTGDKKYTLVINKFKKKGTNELGTGITYATNGDISKAQSSMKVNSKFIEKIAEEIADNVKYNKTFYTLNHLSEKNTNDNKYMYKENDQFVINIGGNKKVFKSFGEFAFKENAFKTNQGINEHGGFYNNTDNINSLFIDVSVLNRPTIDGTPVEGQYQSISDTIRTATTNKLNDTRELLEKAKMDSKEIDFLFGMNEFNISLVPEKYGYDKNATHAFAKYEDGKVMFTKKGSTEANKSIHTLRRLLLHENLHKRFDELSLFKQKALVNDLLDIYDYTIESVNKILETEDKSSELYRRAASFKIWIDKNKFNIDEYFGKDPDKYTEDQKRRIFAEEWLVETLSQDLHVNLLNSIKYKDEQLLVEGIEEEDKSIWQKIIDLLLKLFGVNTKNIKNNTIFAKEYLLLSSLEETNNNIETTTEEKVVEEENLEEVIEEENPKETDEDVEVDEETYYPDEDEESDNDEDTEFNIEDEEGANDIGGLDAKTTSAVEYDIEYRNILKYAPRNEQGQLLAPNKKPSNLTEQQYAQVRTREFKEWFGDWENDPKNASKVVDENGEPLVAYHGTPWGEFTEFKHFQPNTGDRTKSGSLYFGTSKFMVQRYTRGDYNKGKNQPKIYEVFLNIKNPYYNISGVINSTKELIDNIKEFYDAIGNDDIYQNIVDKTLSNYNLTNETNGKFYNYNIYEIISNYYKNNNLNNEFNDFTKRLINDKKHDGMFFVTKEELDTKNIKLDNKQIWVINPNQIKSATDNIGTFSKEDNNIYFANTSTAEEIIIDNVANDGNATAETFSVIKVTNMMDYVNMFAEQDKLLIAKMIENDDIKYMCR